MTDSNAIIANLHSAEPLRAPLMRRIITGLRLPPGSHGLDVGCGIGLQALELARAVGEGGHVCGVDVLDALLDEARRLARQAGLEQRVDFRQGDMLSLPCAPRSLDWAWSADCAGYPSGDLAPLLAELTRVLKPGGRVMLLAWTAQQLLPGHPLLEANLNASASCYAPYLRGVPPEQHFTRALGALRAAGLTHASARSFIGEVSAPLSAGERAALAALFDMLWDVESHGLAAADRDAALRLCDPASPGCILDTREYYAFFTYTMFEATVPGG